jgi:hypothetical protein
VKLSQRFTLAGVLTLIGGIVLGVVPVGSGCGGPIFHGATDDAACLVAQGTLRGPAVALIVIGAMLWLVGVGRLGFDDVEDRNRS